MTRVVDRLMARFATRIVLSEAHSSVIFINFAVLFFKKRHKFFSNIMAKKAQKAQQDRTRLIEFFHDKKVHIIFGVLLLFVMIYTTLALVSFLYTGKNDQSILSEYNTKKIEYKEQKSQRPLSDTDKDNLRKMREELQQIQKKAQNIMGYRGAAISENLLNQWLGIGVFALCAFGFVVAIRLLGLRRISVWKALLLFVFVAVWLSLLLAFAVDKFVEDSFLRFGGTFGIEFDSWLEANIGALGTLLVLVASGIIFAIIAIGGTVPFFKKLYHDILEKNIKLPFVKSGKNRDNNDITTDNDENNKNEDSVKIGDEIIPEDWKAADTDDATLQDNVSTDRDEIEIIDTDSRYDDDDTLFVEIETNTDTTADKLEDNIDIVEIADEHTSPLANSEPYDPRGDLSQYVIPKFYDRYKDKPLLTDYPTTDISQSDEDKMASRKKIVDTLQKFGIGIKKIYETVGPTVTLYEIVPEDGIRINKIRNLSDDIMLSLAATGIRIIAPIPGKGTIGIEVPNSKPQIVSMFATIASKKFQESTYDLPIALGRTITNEVFMFDLCKMPHLLVAGATGQGKSVGLNAIITSLLFKKHPAELKFVLIDPKKVEFNIYADIERHFLAKLPDEEEPVITDVEKVKQTLNSLCKEMDNRYDLLKTAHARNIKEYNEKFVSRHLNPLNGHRYLPYIVVIVDEFGDLIMTAGKEVEMPIARIAQLARAVGIHMVIATQRPSVNIITGVIKANFPARVAFKVSSGVDSKTILDGPGAQQLIGRGDLLFSQGNEPTRVQCAFVDTPEVENIVHFIGNQQGYTGAFPLPEPDIAEGGGEKKEIDISKRDSLFEEVARFVVSTQQGSASTIQRKFEIGFNRAGRIVDQLEAAGIVGPINGSKPRQVLVPTEYELEKILNG